jgi:hypothetical protein
MNAVDVLTQIEPQYFVDYVRLTGIARDYVADTLRRAMEADPNDARRRLHLLGLVGQEYAAYEDAVALESLYGCVGAVPHQHPGRS